MCLVKSPKMPDPKDPAPPPPPPEESAAQVQGAPEMVNPMKRRSSILSRNKLRIDKTEKQRNSNVPRYF